MHTEPSPAAVAVSPSIDSQMNAEHAASWERWRARAAASDRRSQALMRNIAIAIGLVLTASAVTVFLAR
jgi:hypothetical protein